MSLSNLDIHYLVGELKQCESQHIQKVYGKENVFRLKFRVSDVVVELPGRIYLAKNPPQFEEHPSSFIMLLRKHLLGKLERVEQVNFDRILRFVFPTASLVFEFFGEGNLLLCNKEGEIIKPLRAKEYAARKLKAKEPYSPPPMEKKHPAEFCEWENLKGRVVSALSKRVNLSPFYLEEACARASVELDTKVEELTEGQKQAIQRALKSLLEEYAPTSYAETASPITLKKLGEGRRAETLSELLENAPQEKKEGTDKKAFLLQQQKKALAEFEEKEKEALAKAEWLKSNACEIEEFLSGGKTSLKVVKKGFLAEIEA